MIERLRDAVGVWEVEQEGLGVAVGGEAVVDGVHVGLAIPEGLEDGEEV